MKTLSELKSELAYVDQLLYATWLQEREVIRRRIAEMAVEFQLSQTTVARDIEAAQRSAEPAPPVLRPPKVDLPLRKEGTSQHIATRYRNAATGDAWTGRGLRPRWLRDALEAGAVLEDFLLQGAQVSGDSDPLREFQTRRVGRVWLTKRSQLTRPSRTSTQKSRRACSGGHSGVTLIRPHAPVENCILRSDIRARWPQSLCRAKHYGHRCWA